MDVVLQNDLILIRTDFDTMRTPWMHEFLSLHWQYMLFVPNAVLIFSNSAYASQKQAFIEALSKRYAQSHEFSYEFYLRCMMHYASKPIKIELHPHEEIQPVTVELFAHDAQTVIFSLYAPNPWVFYYLKSQLGVYVREANETSLVIDVTHMRSKSRLERTLNKRHLLHYSIEYRYDHRFMSRLYGDYAHFAFDEDDDMQETFDSMMHYYTVLECPVGATQDALRRSYKKLVRVYHPDRVHCENDDMIHRYTQKFQLLQEAYTALRIVS